MSRSRTFDDGVVTVRRDRGEVTGSQIQASFGTVVVPHFPSRIKDVRRTGVGDVICVEMKTGEKRFFGPEDALRESGGLSETKAGGSMGGHDPRAHGKIRYIVRSFGKWARGKHSVCVDRIATEHPEVAKGKNLNALCAWLKDQWTGNPKWRGSKKDPKQVAEEKTIRAKAKSTAYARFSHAMPQVSHAELDLFVEAARRVQPLSEVLKELGVEVGDDDDPFVCLFEHDAIDAELTIRECEEDLRAGEGDARVLVESWLAAQGDIGQVNPENLEQAVERIVRGSGPLHARSKLDRRVIEAKMREATAPDPWATAGSFSESVAGRVGGPLEVFGSEAEQPAEDGRLAEGDGRDQAPVIQLPPPAGQRYPAIVFARGGYEPLAIGESTQPPASILRLGISELQEEARKLYERTAEPTAEGRRYIMECELIALGRVVYQLREALNRPRTGALGAAGDQPGKRTDSKEVTDVSTVSPPAPPNLRKAEANAPRRCGGCMHFDQDKGLCRAHAVKVARDDVCDNYTGLRRLMEHQRRVAELFQDADLDLDDDEFDEGFRRRVRAGKPVKSAHEDSLSQKKIKKLLKRGYTYHGGPGKKGRWVREGSPYDLADELVDRVGEGAVRAFVRQGSAVTGHDRVRPGQSRARVDAARRAAQTRRAREPVRRELATAQAKLAAAEERIGELERPREPAPAAAAAKPAAAQEGRRRRGKRYGKHECSDVLDFVRNYRP